MKVTIHLSHAEGDDLTGVEAAARLLGCEVTRRGGFMGKHHTELSREMDAATLASLLLQAQDHSADAA
jgi:hypothetical protein